jgi:hypothetical protein
LYFSSNVPRSFLLPAFALLSALAASAQDLNGEAANLIARARANTYSADYSADVLCVRDSYLSGADSLRGVMEFRDSRGERRLTLGAGGSAFEWWSRRFGAEQWRRDGAFERLRRIPPHNLKKPAMAPAPMSYEDLQHFPLGYLEGFLACKRLQETDSTYELTLTFPAGVSSRYASAEVTLGKSPVVLRRMRFAAAPGKPAKSLEIAGYRVEQGLYQPSDLRVSSGEGLTWLRLLMRPRAGAAATGGTDKTQAPMSAPAIRRDPRWERGDKGSEGAE